MAASSQIVDKQFQSRWLLITLGALAATGLGVRLLLLLKAHWMADYDEAMIGLMGIDITQGARPIFLYGQPYLGAIEAYLLAAVFGPLGANHVTLKIVPLAVSLMWMATTFVLARRLAGRRAAMLAVAITAVPPLYVLVTTSKAWGGTIETMALGNVVLLCTVEAADDRSLRRVLWLALLGLCVGFSFWLHWLGAYYVMAAVLYLAIRDPALFIKPGTWAALPLFAIGSLPLWIYNLQHNWTTFRYLLSGVGNAQAGPDAAAVAWDLFSRLIPRVLGVESVGNPWPGWLAVALVAAGAAGVIVCCVRERWQRHPSPAEIVLLFVVSVPFLYVASGFGRPALNPYGVDATGRYVVPLFSAVPLIVAVLYSRLSRWLARAVVMLMIAINLVGIINADATQAFQSPYYNRCPPTFAPVIAALREEGLRYVWTDIGLGQPLMFESNREILTADYVDYKAGGLVRFPSALEAVRTAERTAYLVAILPGQIGPLERQFQRLGVGYRKREVGSLALFVPDRRVDPAEVVAGLGMQY